MSRNESRRDFLKQGAGLVLAGATVPLWNLLSGCQGGQDSRNASPASGPVMVPLALVPEGRRTVVDVHGKPVELLRQDGGVTARSLRCTHQGCKVAWREADQEYVCPCHDGRFDHEGQPVYGMPRRALPLLHAVVRDDVIEVSA